MSDAFSLGLLILGGVIEGLPELIKMVETEVKGHALAVTTGQLRAIKAALGGDADVIWAAALARNEIMGRSR